MRTTPTSVPPERHSQAPEVCPCCGAAGEGFTTCVEVTLYDGQYTEWNGDFDAEGDPEEQAVRVFCTACNKYLPLTSSYANALQMAATR